MRVALLVLSVRGSMGQYIEALAPHLTKKVEVHLFVPQHFKGKASCAVVHRFPTGRTRPQALRAFLDPRNAGQLWGDLLSVQPDVLHLFNGEGYPWSIFLARQASNVGLPLLLTLHDPDPHPGNFWEWANAALRRVVIPRARSVHVHARLFVEAAYQLGARHVEVIPHGSLAERFLRHRREGVSREPVALFFGRLEAYKGLDVLIEAGLLLRGKMRVVIAGPGKLSLFLLRKISTYSEIFELHNRYIPDQEAALLFQRASVLVLPYRQATQSSLPLIAAAFGLPVVASAVGAFVEDVPRVGGVLVPPADPKSLAHGILAAMDSKPTYPKELEFSQLAPRFVRWYKDAVG